MKKIIGISLFLFFGISSVSLAQSTVDKAGHAVKHGAKSVGHATAKGAKKVGHATEKGAKAVGNETAEVASKGKSKVVDKTYKNKVVQRDKQSTLMVTTNIIMWMRKATNNMLPKQI